MAMKALLECKPFLTLCMRGGPVLKLTLRLIKWPLCNHHFHLLTTFYHKCPLHSSPQRAVDHTNETRS